MSFACLLAAKITNYVSTVNTILEIGPIWEVHCQVGRIVAAEGWGRCQGRGTLLREGVLQSEVNTDRR